MSNMTRKHAQTIAVAFNRKHKPGTDVAFIDDDGAAILTKTRSEAAILGGHSVVVWIDGRSGCVALDRIHPLRKDKKREDAPMLQGVALAVASVARNGHPSLAAAVLAGFGFDLAAFKAAGIEDYDLDIIKRLYRTESQLKRKA